MATIGNPAEASTLLAAVRADDVRPAGFCFLGAGAYRKAYKSGTTDVVYKIDHLANAFYDAYNPAYTNFGEWLSFTACVSEGRTVSGWRLPIMECFEFGDDVVIATEYVDTYAYDAPADALRNCDPGAACRAWNLEDMHGANYRWCSRTRLFVPIDMGSRDDVGGETNDEYEPGSSGRLSCGCCPCCCEGHGSENPYRSSESSPAVSLADWEKELIAGAIGPETRKFRAQERQNADLEALRQRLMGR